MRLPFVAYQDDGATYIRRGGGQCVRVVVGSKDAMGGTECKIDASRRRDEEEGYFVAVRPTT